MGQRVFKKIVTSGRSLPTVPVRDGKALTKQVHFSNFAAGHLVGTSVAYHSQGEGCEVHNHRGAVEQFFVLDGAGIIEIDGVVHEVRQDDCVVVPPGAWHRLTGTSEWPFKVLCTFVAAPGHEDDEAPWRPVGA